MKDIILALAIAISAMLEQDPARAAGLDTVADLTGPMPTGITVEDILDATSPFSQEERAVLAEKLHIEPKDLLV